jgi:radical SAM superfamily enzyme YgiQ (UPF0313 family)
MKIFLIYPYFLEDRIHTYDVSVPPIGIYYVGAMLKENGYEVQILNWYDARNAAELIEQILTKEQPDILGFSILHANRWGAIDIATMAKNIDPDITVVLGGIGATFLWEQLLAHFKCIDYIVLGEGEISFLQLVQAIDTGKDFEAIKIPGIAFRHQNKIRQTKTSQPIENLDRLPNPAKYFNYQHVAFTRGCPGNCSFCGSPRFWGRRVRSHSPDYFVDQLNRLSQKGVSFFYFSDDTFTFNPALVKEICQKIISKNLAITWMAIARVNHIRPDILKWMRLAGCIQISFGIESGSETIRKSLGKPIKTAQIKKAFQMVQSHGIMSRAYFIYGFPDESPESIQASVDLIMAIKPLSIITYILDIFPGTRIYQDLLAQGRIHEDIWLKRIEDLLYFEIDNDLDQETVREYGHRLRQAFYQNLPSFLDAITLIDDPKLQPYHADFYSRLGLTFSHGDYATIEAIPGDKAAIAEKLFHKALTHHTDHRSYLGLGMIYQHQGRHQDSIDIVKQGLKHFADSNELKVCQGINYMNQGRFQTALHYFEDYKDQAQVRTYIDHCRRGLESQDLNSSGFPEGQTT